MERAGAFSVREPIEFAGILAHGPSFAYAFTRDLQLPTGRTESLPSRTQTVLYLDVFNRVRILSRSSDLKINTSCSPKSGHLSHDNFAANQAQ